MLEAFINYPPWIKQSRMTSTFISIPWNTAVIFKKWMRRKPLDLKWFPQRNWVKKQDREVWLIWRHFVCSTNWCNTPYTSVLVPRKLWFHRLENNTEQPALGVHRVTLSKWWPGCHGVNLKIWIFRKEKDCAWKSTCAIITFMNACEGLHTCNYT